MTGDVEPTMPAGWVHATTSAVGAGRYYVTIAAVGEADPEWFTPTRPTRCRSLQQGRPVGVKACGEPAVAARMDGRADGRAGTVGFCARHLLEQRRTVAADGTVVKW